MCSGSAPAHTGVIDTLVYAVLLGPGAHAAHDGAKGRATPRRLLVAHDGAKERPTSGTTTHITEPTADFPRRAICLGSAVSRRGRLGECRGSPGKGHDAGQKCQLKWTSFSHLLPPDVGIPWRSPKNPRTSCLRFADASAETGRRLRMGNYGIGAVLARVPLGTADVVGAGARRMP